MALKDFQFVSKYGWMITKLGLKDNNLEVFAIIYSFSKTGKWYTGGYKGLTEWCSCTEGGARKNIDALLERNLIIKEKNGTAQSSPCRFKSNMDEIEKQTGLNLRKSLTKNSFEPNQHNNHNNQRPIRYY